MDRSWALLTDVGLLALQRLPSPGCSRQLLLLFGLGCSKIELLGLPRLYVGGHQPRLVDVEHALSLVALAHLLKQLPRVEVTSLHRILRAEFYGDGAVPSSLLLKSRLFGRRLGSAR